MFTTEERSRRVGAAFRTPFLRHSTAKPEEASLQNSIQEAAKAIHGHSDQTNCNTKASGLLLRCAIKNPFVNLSLCTISYSTRW